jgi:hypothetical protein
VHILRSFLRALALVAFANIKALSIVTIMHQVYHSKGERLGAGLSFFGVMSGEGLP